MDLFKNDSDSSSDSSGEDMAFGNGEVDQSTRTIAKKTHVADFQLLPQSKSHSQTFWFIFVNIEDQGEVLFDQSVEDMDKFFIKLNQFENLTNASLRDIWKKAGPQFQPVKVQLDL